MANYINLNSFASNLCHFLFVAIIFWNPSIVEASAAIKVSALSMPVESSSWQSLNRGLSGLIVKSDRIISFATDKAYIFDTKIKNINGKTREATFGGLIESMRAEPYKDDMAKPIAIGGFVTQNKIIIMNGLDWSMIELDSKSLKEIWRRTMVLDLLKPPADRGGEPPSFETAALRTSFSKSVKKASRNAVAGITEEGETGAGRRKFFLLTRVEGFPLLQMECDSQEVSQCIVTRQCNLPLPAGLDRANFAGIAYDSKRKKILIGDSKNHRLLQFEFRSCFDIRHSATLMLPAKLKKLSNIYVDQDSRLWLTSSFQDDYLNASLYFWNQW